MQHKYCITQRIYGLISSTMLSLASTRVISLLIIFVMFTGTASIHAQSGEKGFWSGWSVNLNGGASLFYGDVEHSGLVPAFTDKNEWRMGYGLILQKRFGPVFSVRGQLFNGQLSGSKKHSNYWFETDLLETSMSLRMDVLNLFRRIPDSKFEFYLMAGVGLAHWKSNLMKFETEEIIRGNGNNKTGSGLFGRTVEGVIPFGGGIEYTFNKNWSANLEISLRPVNSDKLDSKVGMFEYDFYSYDFIGISYHFHKKQLKEPDLIRDELAIEEVEMPIEESAAAEEPVIHKPEAVLEKELVKQDQDIERTIDDKLLDKEYRTGLFESPWPGVEFTVQIAALKVWIDPEKISKQFNIEGKVLVMEADGWYRYSVGRYIKYWKAREYKNILVTRNNIKDAFVVAYRDNQRLMLSQLIEMEGINTEEQRAAKQQRVESKISFSVQVLATTNGNISPGAIHEMFEIDADVIREENNGLFRYTAGIFSSYNDAAKLRNQLKARGISGAFVVGYRDGKRTEIRNLMK